jgi:hypothetical protein
MALQLSTRTAVSEDAPLILGQLLSSYQQPADDQLRTFMHMQLSSKI